jgi:23S rRNA pseudouridine1911/1915/1917 synthase
MHTLTILYEDKDILVCHKPAGVASQSDRSFLPDMVSMIRNHLLATGQVKSGTIPYVGVVHRLDKPVSGILVYGKNQSATAALSAQVSGNGAKKMQKYYRATVYGTLPIDAVVKEKVDYPHLSYPHKLTDILVQDVRSNTSHVADRTDSKGKKATLSYCCTGNGEKNGISISQLAIQLETGRHHQIRVQLSNLGYPIVGDTKYGPVNQKCPLELCACSLTFTHPKGQIMTYTI